MELTNTTTADATTSVLLSIRKDDDGRYHVRDLTGLRYGHSGEPLLALIEWWWQVRDLLDIDEPTGPPLSNEIAAYRAALDI